MWSRYRYIHVLLSEGWLAFYAVQKLGKEDFANENLEKWFWNRWHVHDRFRMEPEQILKVRY